MWLPIAAALVLAGFLPTLIWNATHDWLSFKFQFGRVGAGRLSSQYMLEFIAAQIALASPFILFVAVVGLFKEARAWMNTGASTIASAVVWPAVAYFLVHAAHNRVQGNWPSFIYPALSVLAASAMLSRRNGKEGLATMAARVLALPFAGIMLIAVYAQAWADVLHWRDPVSRMTAFGFEPVVKEISAVAAQDHAGAVLTANYVTTAWLAFYMRPHVPVVQITEDYRWLQVPHVPSQLLHAPLIYVTQHPDRELGVARVHFRSVQFKTMLTRERNGTPIDKFFVYELSGFHGPSVGRLTTRNVQ